MRGRRRRGTRHPVHALRQRVRHRGPPVTAGETYVASYFGTSGYFADDERYFADGGPGAQGIQTTDMAAPATPNGLETLDGRGLPGSSDGANYWVQPVFYPNVTNDDIQLSAPTSLTATPLSDGEVRLDWSGARGATALKVVMTPEGGAATSTTVPMGQTTFLATGLQADTRYWFYVEASNPIASESSGSVLATTPPVPVPTGLTATAVSESTIDLQWTDPSSGKAVFNIERSLDGSHWATVGPPVGPGVTSFADIRLTNGTTYSYRISATDAAGTSAFSDVASATTIPIPPLTELTATAASDAEIDLTWTDSSSGRTGFTLQRSANGADGWTPVGGAIAPGVTSFRDTGLIEGTPYSYRVAATDAAGTSVFSNVAGAQTPYATPTVASAAAAGQTTVTGTTDTLSVLGALADGGQESSLTYAWAVLSGPGGATFSLNGTNDAKNTTVTFAAAGTYTLQATIQNGPISVTSSVQVTVSQTVTSIVVTPADVPAIAPGATQQFSATAYDQFGAAISPPPTFVWSVAYGGGSIDSTGLFTASSQGGPITVQATAGGVSSQTQATVYAGPYRVTITGRAYEQGYNSSGATDGLTVTQTGWIDASSPEDAVQQAISGNVTLNTGYTEGHSTLSFPQDLGSEYGFAILASDNQYAANKLTWDSTNSQYTGAIGMWDGDPGAKSDWDFYWNVRVDVITGMLDVLQDDGNPLSRAEKQSTGGYVIVNDDNDDYSFDTDGNAIPDDQKTSTIVGEHDLKPIVMRAISANAGGRYTLSWTSPNIKIWMNPDKSPGTDADGSTVSAVVSDQTQFDASKDTTVWVEGLNVSDQAGAEQVALNWLAPTTSTGGGSAGGNPPLNVDYVKMTVDDIKGPLNVPSYSEYSYHANEAPGSPASPTIAWSASGGTVTDQGQEYPGDTAKILWDKGPANSPTAGWFGTVTWTPEPGFSLTRQVNVVQVSFSNTASLTAAKLGAPVQSNGVGSPLIEASNANVPNFPTNVAVFFDANGNGTYDYNNGAAGDDALLVDAHGPVINGVERGLRYIVMGFTQQAELVQQSGHYIINNTDQYLTGQLQDGQTHWDNNEPNPGRRPMWVLNNSDRYLSPGGASERMGGVTKHPFYWSDDPILSGTDPARFKWLGSQVNDLNIVFRNHTYFAVAKNDSGILSVDTLGAPSDSVQTERLSLDWTFNGSGPIDAQGEWHPGANAGVTLSTPTFEEETNGERIQPAVTDLAQLWQNEGWIAS